MKHLLLAVFMLAVAGVPALATQRYVAKTGNDGGGNTCTNPLLPCLTITRGVSQLVAGDTLNIGNGIYAETIIDTIPSGVSALAPTIILATNSLMVTLRPTSAPQGYVIRFHNQSNIVLDGLVADAQSASNSAGIGCDNGFTCSNITIRNGKAMNGNGEFGSGIDGGYSNSTIQNMDVTHNGVGTVLGKAHGIYISGPNNLVTANRVSLNTGYGIHVYQGTSPAANSNTISGNTSFSNDRAGILVGGNSSGNNVFNNIVYSNGGDGGIHLFSSAANTGVLNNTIYSNTGACLHNEAVATGNLFRNNICRLNSGGAVDATSGLTCSNNFNVTGCGSTQGTTDPLFTNAGSADFTLQALSTAIDAGTTLGAVTADFAGTPRPQGSAYDEGAYERSASGPPAGTPPIEAFDYITGILLDCQNGGQFWTACWQNTGSNTMTVETGPAGSPGGGNAARSFFSGGGSYLAFYQRGFGALNAGTVPLSVYVTNCSPAGSGTQHLLGLRSAGTDEMVVRISAGQFQAFDGSGAGYTNVGACTANTWTTITIDFDDAMHADQFRVKVGSGAYSSYLTVSGTTYSTVDTFMIYDANGDAHALWVDDIGVTACAADKLVFTSQPASSVIAGQTLGPIAVSVMCADGTTVVNSSTASIAMAKTGGTCTGMTLNGTTPVSAVNGVASFSLSLTGSAGACTLTASTAGLTDGVSSGITLTQTPLISSRARMRARSR